MAQRRRKRRQDAFGKRARREGFPARSVYKLEEIDRKVSLLRRGDRILDLGAHPGSWSLYAAEKVGREGRVLGIDLTAPRGAVPPNVELREGDVLTLDPQSLDGPFDVVMSDMAPATTGQRDVDQARSHELAMRALTIAEAVLVPGGRFATKIFQGPDFEEARDRIRAVFEKVKIVRPKAVRTESFETYIVGLGRRPRGSEPTS